MKFPKISPAPLSLCLLFVFSSWISSDLPNRKTIRQFEKAYSNFIYIPSTSFYGAPDHGAKQLSDSAKIVKIEGFWISKYEVTNAKWRSFVWSVRQSEGEEAANRLLPDTSGWLNEHYLNTPLKNYYYSHPAYKDYPVVNISYAQCEAYCKWLSERIKKEFEGNPIEISVELPTELEWEYAAGAGMKQTYPFGHYLRTNKGGYQANFRVVNMGDVVKKGNKLILSKNYKSQDASLTPAPVNIYNENEFGLFNMAGNVAEFVKPHEGRYFTKGGSFFDPPHYMKTQVREAYPADSSAQFNRGFRPVVRIEQQD